MDVLPSQTPKHFHRVCLTDLMDDWGEVRLYFNMPTLRCHAVAIPWVGRNIPHKKHGGRMNGSRRIRTWFINIPNRMRDQGLFIYCSLSSRCCVTDRSVHSRPLTSFDTFHFESSVGRVLCLKIETESFVGIIVLLAANVSFCVARLTVWWSATAQTTP